jgi:hypothetical protein
LDALKSRKEEVRIAAMGFLGVQKPACRVEGRFEGAVDSAECLWRGFWRTVWWG